ncbi:MAG: hypothetical protein DYG94_13865 [Leptolyngbya sp. PLA3]|nr:MAG: hypothetical protein EDM82_14420 [Cyanobacteria bacterium CYA]MCE7969814.1 hypothetical protein [Leptolyngbya sp. PL-A3]
MNQFTVPSLALFALAAGAVAQPAPLEARTAGLLVGDQDVDAIYRVRDLNGDRDALDVGERTLWLDASNASGLPGPFGSVLTMFQSASGAVFIGEGDTDTVYRAFDLNADGDALDAGEVRVWISPANAAGYFLPTPSGIWETEPGVVFVFNVGTVSTPGDAIYRTQDLNADGDANDPGEMVLWFDVEGEVGDSSAFELVFIGNRAFWTDLRGGNTDAILWAEDLNSNGEISGSEWGIFMDVNNAFGAPVGIGLKTDGTSLYVAHNLSSADQSLYRLTDLNGNGVIDSADEAVQVWNESLAPTGVVLGSIFTLAIGPETSVALGSSGSNEADAVLLLQDLDSDRRFTSADESLLFVGSGSATGEPAQRVRALEFVSCPADLNLDGQVDFFDVQRYLAWFSAGDPRADLIADNNFDFFDVQAYLNMFSAACS